MASGGEDDGVTTDQPEALASEHPEIFYNTAGRYQTMTGKNSAYDLLDLNELFLSDPS